MGRTQGDRIYYLATPPSYFPIIIKLLHDHRLLTGNSRIIVEKPFGSDLQSALALQQDISKYLDSDQVYLMDHYLGKEGVQNLLTIRFENTIFEPLWNNEYIDHVQITMSEDIGIGSRAQFWEETGLLRDIVQNHFMQILALLTMEQPATLNAVDVHAEKIRVLNAIRPFPLADLDKYIIRGQYVEGEINGTEVPGYKQEVGVPPNSSVETYIAAKLFIDNARWKGVPFYLRAGKRLSKQTTEIVITFKKSRLR